MTQKIQLSRGMTALVDDEDFERISQWKWYAIKCMNLYYGARNSSRTEGKKHIILMHRSVFEYHYGSISIGLEIDHISGDTTDNQTKNLRAVTHRENLQNIHSKKSSRFPGVSWSKKDNRWVSHIGINGKLKYLGAFTEESLASEAYIRACDLL
jgi:hypothetical protein